MAISKDDAMTAIRNLSAQSGAKMLETLQGANDHLYGDHLSKEAALRAVDRGGVRKSYFKQETIIDVDDVHLIETFSEGQIKRLSGVQLPKKLVPRNHGKLFPKGNVTETGHTKVTTTQRHQMNETTFANMLHSTIHSCSVHGAYYEANADKDHRFMVVTRLPDGIIGLQVDHNGGGAGAAAAAAGGGGSVYEKNARSRPTLTHIALLIIARDLQEPQIFNAYPVNPHAGHYIPLV